MNVPLPPGGAVLRSAAPGTIRLARFSDLPLVEAGSLPGGDMAATLEIPPDAWPEAWRITFAGSAPLVVCPLPAGT